MEIKLYPILTSGLYTELIQNAINDCSENGGGTVFFTKGVYETGTIFWKSNVRIFLDFGAEIKGSENPEDYPKEVYKQMYKKESHMDRALFFAENCENIILEGYGKINGNGADMRATRPMMFRYLNTKNIRINNVKMEAPASWTNAFINCQNIWVSGIDIFSRANGNGDGLDFDACQNVFVSDCKFDCSDDCICLQNSFEDKICENIVVTNCVFKTRWAGMRIGLLSCNTIKDLTVSNCIFRNIDCSGLKIQTAEGAVIENMTFTNLVMEDVVRPMLITANKFRERTDRTEDINSPSILRNMTFNNIMFKSVNPEFLKGKETQPKCITIDCDKGDVIENIMISNMRMEVLGENTYEEREIPSHTGIRAEGHNYKGLLPAYGLFARNVKDLEINNFDVKVQGDEKREKIVII